MILRIFLSINLIHNNIKNHSGYHPILLFQRYSGLNLERSSRSYYLTLTSLILKRFQLPIISQIGSSDYRRIRAVAIDKFGLNYY